jgi:RND family efflux transporter MFP subunit
MSAVATHDKHRGGFRLKEPSDNAKRWLLIAGIAAILFAAVFVGYNIWHRRHAAKDERDKRTEELAKGPWVNVAKVDTTAAPRDITLPGDVRGFQQTTLYAKIAGYVKDIRVERGQKVRADQILAVVFSPETDAQVRSARSNAEVTKINAERNLRLASPGVVSEVDRDNALNMARMADAQLAQAADLKAYELVRAPFAGTVTTRYVDNGALLPAATTSTSQAQPVVDLADTDTLRVLVYVGQDAAPFVHMGLDTEIWQDERPEQIVHAQMTHCTGALDPRTRTMQCEIDFDNRPYGIQPGTFMHVRIHLIVPPQPAVPDEALVVKNGKYWVGLVKDGKAQFVEVQLGTNDGRTVRITRGLQGGETVMLSAPMELEDGSPVQAREKQTPKPNPPSGAVNYVPKTDPATNAGRPTLDENNGAKSGGASKGGSAN